MCVICDGYFGRCPVCTPEEPKCKECGGSGYEYYIDEVRVSEYDYCKAQKEVREKVTCPYCKGTGLED